MPPLDIDAYFKSRFGNPSANGDSPSKAQSLDEAITKKREALSVEIEKAKQYQEARKKTWVGEGWLDVPGIGAATSYADGVVGIREDVFTQPVQGVDASPCNDPAVSAQLKRLMQRLQPGFSCSTPDVGVGGCKSVSSRRSRGWHAARFQSGAGGHIAL